MDKFVKKIRMMIIMKSKLLINAPYVFLDGKTGDSTHLRENINNFINYFNTYVICKTNNFHEHVLNINCNRYYNKYINAILLQIKSLIYILYVLSHNNINYIYERDNIIDSGIIIGKLLHINSTLELNGIFPETKEKTIIHNILYVWNKLIFTIADNIIVGVDETKNILINEYKINDDKIHVVPNGANTNVFSPMIIKKEEMGLSEKISYICFIGNITNWQGIERMIDVAEVIKNNMDDICFLIVGDGVMRQQYSSEIKQRGLTNYFIFVGDVPYENVPKYINVCDYCITLKKNLRSGYSPTKLYEYLSCGKPIIASNYSAHKIIKYENIGLLVNENDINDVYSAIKYYSSIPDKEKNRISIVAREFIIHNYSWKSTTNKIIDIMAKK